MPSYTIEFLGAGAEITINDFPGPSTGLSVDEHIASLTKNYMSLDREPSWDELDNVCHAFGIICNSKTKVVVRNEAGKKIDSFNLFKEIDKIIVSRGYEITPTTTEEVRVTAMAIYELASGIFSVNMNEYARDNLRFLITKIHTTGSVSLNYSMACVIEKIDIIGVPEAINSEIEFNATESIYKTYGKYYWPSSSRKSMSFDKSDVSASNAFTKAVFDN